MDLRTLAYVILLAPFIAFLLNSFVVQRVWRAAGIFTVLGVLLSFLASVLVFLQVQAGARLDENVFNWLTVAPGGAAAVTLGVRVDQWTALMLLAVTGVSFLVQVYSWGYLHEAEMDEHGHVHIHRDPGFARYFTYMALFTFSMLGLVLANGFLGLFIFWELVGLCSYLLIGFWYYRGRTLSRGLFGAAAGSGMTDERLSPPEAAKKAFLTTRLGDFGFLVGLLFIWAHFQTFNFTEIEHAVGGMPEWVPTVAALLVFCGAIGKSAQWPLHVWLPDAMEGPTPVSALIHAATMVAAGVYLMARSAFLLEHAPNAMLVVALIGGFTAFFAATLGLVNNDIKRVMAYSTVSQLGYMMLGIGVGAVAAGIFHLFTHSWFKALLFLTSGSVIHSTGSQDMREMGGLGAKMPGTFWAMTLAGLSLAGFPLFSGFWSKDAIVGSIPHAHLPVDVTPLLLFFAVVTAFMTAFYTMRVIAMTFFGEWRGDRHVFEHVHEAPATMLWPMLILIPPAVLVGLIWGGVVTPPGMSIPSFLEGHTVVEEMNMGLVGLVTVLVLLGLLLGWLMYGARSVSAAAVTRVFGPLYGWAANKWGFDDLYNWLVGSVVVGLANALALLDRGVVDGVVNGLAQGTVALGRAFRGIQTGQVQTYAWVVFGGLVVVALAVVLPVLFGFRV
ncbi:MAG TPA: NADH-quinone oxidoreductase subunit L [Chloroflexota bacterium]|nr:NADH-quinone oxidoreductase subunit L [Chloroflexota bacterium]